MRLNKYLAHTSGLSRREADTMIAAGRVRVNGQIAPIGTVVHPAHDRVTVNKDDIIQKQTYKYVLLNKPVGYVCSRQKQGHSPTIYELLPPDFKSLKVAGRLDKDSCGLVLLTDDGDMIFELTHPRFKKQKTYHVGLNKPLSLDDTSKILQGIKLEDGISKLQKVAVSKQNKAKNQAQVPNSYKVTMSEGRNRQIRRTFKALGYTVTYLQRISLGQYSLDLLDDKPYLQIQPQLL